MATSPLSWSNSDPLNQEPKIYGYTMDEVREFIMFGKANNFSPHLRPIPTGDIGKYYQVQLDGSIKVEKIEPTPPVEPPLFEEEDNGLSL